MIGLDSNVLIRYLTQDDPKQAARAARLIERELSTENPGFISILVLMETVLVLRRLYKATAAEITDTILDLLRSAQLRFEQRELVAQAVRTTQETRCSFADALIVKIGSTAGCSKTVSFDQGAARAGMTLLKI